MVMLVTWGWLCRTMKRSWGRYSTTMNLKPSVVISNDITSSSLNMTSWLADLFTCCSPQLVCHELMPGGKTMPVTNENKWVPIPTQQQNKKQTESVARFEDQTSGTYVVLFAHTVPQNMRYSTELMVQYRKVIWCFRIKVKWFRCFN